MPSVNLTIYWAIFCLVVLVNVSTPTSHVYNCFVFCPKCGQRYDPSTTRLLGSPLVGKILTSCRAKYETIMYVPSSLPIPLARIRYPIDGWVGYWHNVGQSVGKILPNLFTVYRLTYTDYSYELLTDQHKFTDLSRILTDLTTFTTGLSSYYELFAVYYGLLRVITMYLRQESDDDCYELSRITTSN